MNLPWPAAIVRFVLLSGYALAMGHVSLANLGIVADGRRLRMPWVLGVGLALVAVATVTEFGLLAWNLSDGDVSQLSDAIAPLFASPGSTGSVLAIRLGVLAAVAACHLLLDGRMRRVLLTIGAIALTLLVSVDGHAGDQGWASPLLFSDVLHAWSAATWLGGLGLVWGRLSRVSEDAALDLCGGFSRLASVCYPVAILSGIANAYLHLANQPSLLWTSSYGQLLLAKSAVVLVVLGIAAYLRQLILPGWTAGRCTTRGVNWRLGVELVLGVLILGLTAFLTQTSPT